MVYFLKRLLITVIFLLITGCGHPQPRLHALYSGDVILAFGDSLTFGTGATVDTSYPQVLENITGFKVINAGVPGDQTQDGLARIDDELTKNNPRLVILCLGGNDLLHKKPIADIKANLKKIIEAIKRNGAQVVLVAEPAPNLSLSVPELYQELGDEFQIPVELSILSDLLRQPQYKSDYIHLNVEGYKLFAEAIAELLKKQGALTTK